MWHIGQRVVCVDDKGFNEKGLIYPIKGKVYTIREVKYYPDGDFYSFRLEEIVNQPKEYKQGYGEKAFREFRFKPLDEKRLDIFRAMLVTKKETEKV